MVMSPLLLFERRSEQLLCWSLPSLFLVSLYSPPSKSGHFEFCQNLPKRNPPRNHGCQDQPILYARPHGDHFVVLRFDLERLQSSQRPLCHQILGLLPLRLQLQKRQSPSLCGGGHLREGWRDADPGIEANVWQKRLRRRWQSVCLQLHSALAGHCGFGAGLRLWSVQHP